MINNMLKNKKGGIEEGLTGFYSYTFIFLIFLVAFFIFSINPKMAIESTITAKTSDINSNTVLRNLLNTPVDNGWNVADLIIFSSVSGCINSDVNSLEGYCLSLNNNILKLLGGFKKGQWQLTITYPDARVFLIKGPELSSGTVRKSYKFPSLNGEIKLDLDALAE